MNWLAVSGKVRSHIVYRRVKVGYGPVISQARPSCALSVEAYDMTGRGTRAISRQFRYF